MKTKMQMKAIAKAAKSNMPWAQISKKFHCNPRTIKIALGETPKPYVKRATNGHTAPTEAQLDGSAFREYAKEQDEKPKKKGRPTTLEAIKILLRKTYPHAQSFAVKLVGDGEASIKVLEPREIKLS